eukprot:CAMPEP_0171967360 /NCGR_PEP_ID=MMETSP0993-20121228/197335_1 /TAXON_ID=483369 /ORGANISM="non described non described, Strain CCMP2098" /LENGTH=49 /DNA_ID= /DNA_START= /DNA_END= /DNA_ORIENTATION=
MEAHTSNESAEVAANSSTSKGVNPSTKECVCPTSTSLRVKATLGVRQSS